MVFTVYPGIPDGLEHAFVACWCSSTSDLALPDVKLKPGTIISGKQSPTGKLGRLSQNLICRFCPGNEFEEVVWPRACLFWPRLLVFRPPLPGTPA